MALLGALLCFIPLFNILGYESSAALGAVGGFLVAWLTAHSLRDLERGVLASDSPEDLLARFARLYARHLLLLLAPLGLLLLNALRVPNCDPLAGVAFFLLIAPMALLMGQASAWGASALLSKTWARALLASAILLGNGLWLGLHIALEPPINGHQWLIGYLSGSIYDEALSIPPSLLWYRVENVCLVLAMIFAMEAWRRWRHHKRATPPRRLAIFACGMALLWGGMALVEQDFGVSITRETIAQELGGRVETEHFIIYYPLQERFARELPRLIEDHEFRYAEMQAFFKTDPVALHGQKVRSFVYPDMETKGALMGARRTLIAKIWLREVHILWRDYGDHLLAHELAHVFTEPFGAGPLKLSMQGGIGVNMGLVEGIATAADWPSSELPPHIASATMRQLGIAPDIRGLVGARGFWSQSSGRAYTLMGSFVRFLVDTHGIERFKKAYAHGDFEAAYGRSASALVSEWEAFLEGVPVPQELLEVARFRYERPSIFGKICARTIAELARQAQLAHAGGDVQRASALYEDILSHDPHTIGYHLAAASMQLAAQEDAAALERLDALLSRQLTASERVQIEHLRADIFWRLGQQERAAQIYAQCELVGVSDDMRRLLQVKRAALTQTSPSVRPLARAYLLEGPSPTSALYYPMQWVHTVPDDMLARYLAGRRLWGEQLYEEARQLLPAHGTPLASPQLERELTLMHAVIAYHLKEDARAKKLLKELAESDSSRLRTTATEWLARLAWRAGNSL